MKDPQILIQINQLASEIEKELNQETDIHRNCRLQNAKELLRRAFHEVNGTPYEPNDLIV